MNRVIPIYLILLFRFTVSAQWTLHLSSNVELRTWKLTTKAEKEEKPLRGASIVLSKNGQVVAQTSSDANGDFSVEVPPNDEFILTVSYQNCNSKKFLVNTRQVPEKVGTDNFHPSYSIGGFIMAKPFPGIDYSGLKESLVRVIYVSKGQKFDDDEAATERGTQIVTKISRSENELIEKFCSTNKDGDNALAKPDCPLAKMLYEKAIALIPNEQYPVEQLKKVGDCLKDAEAAKKKQQEELAAKAKQEADRMQAEKAAREQEAAAKAEADKRAADQAASEKANREKAAAEKAETERIAKEKEAALKSEAEKIAKEKEASEKADKEKATAEQAEADRIAKEKAAAEAAEKEKIAREKQASEKAAKEKAAADKAESERLAKEKAETEKINSEKAAREREEAEALALKAADSKQGSEPLDTPKKNEEEARPAQQTAQKANLETATQTPVPAASEKPPQKPESKNSKIIKAKEPDAKEAAELAARTERQKELAERLAKEKEGLQRSKEEDEAAMKEDHERVKAKREERERRAAERREEQKKAHQTRHVDDGVSTGQGNSKYSKPQLLGSDRYKECLKKGDEYLKTKRYAEAKTWYQEALKAKPEDAAVKSKLEQTEKFLNTK